MIETWIEALTRMGVRPSTADDWADTFARVMDEAPFSDDRDIENFMGQVLHESGMLETLQENLNYSAQRLTQVWPRRFPTLASAQPYARNPQRLANFVYGERMGNDLPGDGWRYAGKGLIQLTGKDNYRAMENITGLPLLDEPELLLEQEPALRVSIAWWETNVSDAVLSDVARVTRAVNGGTTGLDHRAMLTRRARAVLAELF